MDERIQCGVCGRVFDAAIYGDHTTRCRGEVGGGYRDDAAYRVVMLEHAVRELLRDVRRVKQEGSDSSWRYELHQALANWDKNRGSGWFEAGDLTPKPHEEVVLKVRDQPRDDVNHPEHYTAGGIECIDAIRAALTPEEFRGFLKGNVVKYTWRERMKGGVESLRKAAWYLKKLTEI